MYRTIQSIVLASGLLLASATYAQAPASAPAGSTGVCKDGSYWTGATKKGACRGHKGVQTWYGASADSSTASPASAAPAAPVAPAASAPAAAAPAASAASTPVAPGGGPGMVWVNKSSKVYHCSNDKWYGKTKNGAYLSVADATAQGYHPDHGKACQ